MARALVAHLGFSDLNDTEAQLVRSFREWLTQSLSNKRNGPTSPVLSSRIQPITDAQILECFEKAQRSLPDFRGAFNALTVQEEILLDEISHHLDAARLTSSIDRLGQDAPIY
ncbi:MAG: hypothetical protein AAFQ28_05830 [Pseudomonadota bacterium]